MQESIKVQKDSDLTADVYSRLEQTQQNIAFFEGKNGKQRTHDFFNSEDSLNGSHLALWAFGQVVLQKQLHQKATRLAGQVARS